MQQKSSRGRSWSDAHSGPGACCKFTGSVQRKSPIAVGNGCHITPCDTWKTEASEVGITRPALQGQVWHSLRYFAAEMGTPGHSSCITKGRGSPTKPQCSQLGKGTHTNTLSGGRFEHPEINRGKCLKWRLARKKGSVNKGYHGHHPHFIISAAVVKIKYLDQ